MQESKGMLETMQTISERDYQILEDYAVRGAQDSIGRRALIILGYQRGLDTADIATDLGITTRSVRRWRQTFETKGMAIFPKGSQSPAEAEPSPMPLAKEEPAQPVEHRSVEQLTEQSGFHAEQADHVRALAGNLFRSLQEVHGLGQEHSRIVEMAAYLHAIHSKEDAKVSAKRTAQYLHQFELEGFSVPQQRLMEVLIRLQRGKIKLEKLTDDAVTLPPEDVRKLIAILRIAVALDQSGTQSTELREIIHQESAIQLVVAGPQAASDAAAAQRRSGLWRKTVSRDLRILTEEQAKLNAFISKEVPFPEPMTAPGISTTDPIAEAGRKTLLYHFAEMLKNEAGTRLGEDIEALHDMRVAVRRMRVAFEVFGEAFSKKTRKRHLKGLRAIGRALGSVRDMDVFIEKAEGYLPGLPAEKRDGLQPLTVEWQSQRSVAREAMLAFLDSEAYRDFLRSFNAFVQTPGRGVSRRVMGRFGPLQVRHLAPRMIYDRLGRVRMFEPILAGASIEEVHELRIEFKKFRYTLEYLREVLGPEIEAVIKEVKAVQDHLGDLNDADVACRILNEFLETWEVRQQQLPLSERQNPEPVVAYLASKHAERHQLMVSFGKTWNKFDSPVIRERIAAAVSAI